MLFGAEVVMCVAVLALVSAGGYSLLSPPPALPEPLKKDKVRVAEALKKGVDVLRYFNFALVGNSGVGKSTLRNRILGILDDTDDRAAPVDINECTKVASYAQHPKSPYIRVWDLPGISPNHTAQVYCTNKALYAYDSLILVCTGRFSENDIMIAKYAREWQIPVFFVRNKVAADIKAAQKTKKELQELSLEVVSERVCTSIKQELCDYLHKRGLLAPKIYCIEAWELDNKYLDGEELLKDVGNSMIRHRKTQ